MKIRRTKNLKVVIMKGTLKAPTIYTDCKKEKDAIADAKFRSGLKESDGWEFIPVSID